VAVIGDASSLVTSLVDDGAVITIAVLVVGALVASSPLRRRFGGSRFAAFASLASLAPVLAVTLFRREGFGTLQLGWSGSRWSWWLHGWGDLAGSSVRDSEFLLNIVLFLGAGALWLWCTRQRWWIVIAWLCALSFSIELFQALFGLGAPDIRDWFANTVGAAIGVGCAALLQGVLGHRLRRPEDPPGERATPVRWTWRRWVAVGCSALAVAVLGITGVRLGASAQQQSLLDELHAAFDNTTKQDLAEYFGANGGLGEFNGKVSVRSDDWRWSDEEPTFEARYPIEFFGITKCVFVRWTAIDVSYRTSSGAECTRFNG
jgi:VanZ like family